PSQTQPIPGPIESRSANIAPSETSIQSHPSSGGQPSPPQDVLARAELPLNHLNASDVLDHIPGVLAAAPKATDFTWINRLVPNATHYASTEPATVTAHLDTGEAGVGQRVSLKIRVTGSKSAEVPETIDADGLEIRRTGSSTWFQMRNNVVNSGVTYDYAVVPLKLGTFRIPSQTIRTANASLVTPGLTLHVVGAPAGAAGIANSTVTRTSSDPFSNIELWSAFPRSMAGRHA